MRKKVSDAITEIGEQVGLDTTNVSANKERVRRWINDVREEIGELPFDFKALQFNGQLRLYASVTAGSVQASSEGRVVTGTSTSFTSNLPDPANQWFMEIDGRHYKIENVDDDTHVTLAIPYAGTATASGQSYRAHRKYLPLDYDIKEFRVIKEHTQPVLLRYVSPDEKEYYYINDAPNQVADYPTAYTTWGSEEIGVETVYTGLSATANSYSVSGASTFLDDDIGPGTKLTFGDSATSTAFTVERVVSDTELRLHQVVSQTAGGMTGTARNENRTWIEFTPQPDRDDVMTYLATRRIHKLHGDGDFLEDGWYDAIRAGAIVRGYEYLKRDTSKVDAKYGFAKARLIRQQTMGNRYPRLKPYIRKRYSGNF